MATGWWVLIGIGGFFGLVVIYDLIQRKRAILRNFPILGHFRYIFEAVGPEFRQYIVTSNDEERPFTRDQRRWVYASSKKENNYFGFGTDNDLESSPNYLIIKHAAFPLQQPAKAVTEAGYPLPCAKTLGGHRGRKHAFRPRSVVNISAMSYGALSARAIEALNRGAKLAGCLHNTGEGGLSPYHQNGGELIFQMGTGYFGCRDKDGRFSLERLVDVCGENPVRAIEIKLSQGAKPGLGGLLPGAKVTREIAQIRGIPVARDCVSPSSHVEFHDVDSMLDFVERVAEATGLPVGIKSAVGELEFWTELGHQMATSARGVDYIAIDGGEGGTGAGPLAFTDHVALPFKVGMARVYCELARAGVHENVVFVGGGRLGLPDRAVLAFALGCDMIAVAREAMMSIGCIQAQRCHTGHCPTGVATQNKWLMRGLDPTSKSARLANYITQMRKELIQLAHACGLPHPGLISTDHLELLDDRFGASTVTKGFGYRDEWGLPSEKNRAEIRAIMAEITGA